MRTKRASKTLSLFLVFCMVFTMVPTVAFAETGDVDSGVPLGMNSVITAFADLDEDVSKQTVEIGMPEEELNLPKELAVTVTRTVTITTGSAIVINETNFPDENFRNWLLDSTNIGGVGADGTLTEADIATVTKLVVSSKGIKSLDGVEYFTALTLLSCSMNLQLTTLDVSKNTTLTVLECSNTKLTTLDVSKNTALTRLNCESNKLTKLDVSQNTALTTLYCGFNELNTLDVSKNTALIWLYCQSNNLTTLNVGKNTALGQLACYNNKLTMLDVSENTELFGLKCYENQLTALDVSKNTKLDVLDCNNNQLTMLDVNNNTELMELYCHNNKLTTLNVSKNVSLQELTCNNNKLTELDVSRNHMLNNVNCTYNYMSDKSVLKVSNIIDPNIYFDPQNSAPTPTTYTITYDKGDGSGTMTNGMATEGVAFTLPDNGFTAPSGKEFKAWKIDTEEFAPGATYTFTGNTTVTAVWKDIPTTPATYTVTINGGGTGATGEGSYVEGVIVNIYAGNRSNYTFTGWTSSDVTITGAGSKNANFVMPTKAVIVTANWSYNGGGSGSGDSSGGSSGGNGGSGVVVTPPAPDTPNAPTQGSVNIQGTVDSNGNITANITNQTVSDTIDKALALARNNGTEQNGIILTLNISTGGKPVNNLSANLPKEVQDAIIAKGVSGLIITAGGSDIAIGMDLAALQEMNRQANGNVNITANRMNNATLTGNARAAIGNRPVFDLKLSYGTGKQVQNFGAGSVSVTIPYTLGTNEKTGNVQAVYVNAKGNVQWLISSVYDSLNGVLSFSTNHFSTYGVGYKQDAPSFTDIGTHWAKEDIAFVANRELISGTSTTTFSPNTAMTRGMFVTALGRLANADVSSYEKSSFTDVKSDAYYMGYIEWANKNNIVNGIGDGKFAPDQSITREQMAVIMQNYAKTIGFTLPKVYVENTFVDSTKISTYAGDAVKQVQMAVIISGKNGNIFDPQGTATRAEVSAVLRRFVELAISSDTAQGWTMNVSGKWMYYENGKPVTGKKNIGGSTYTFDQYGVTADVPKNLRYTTYTVQKNDSFWLIAHNLGCTMSELERLNNKGRFDLIYPGDVLRVPEE